jgi:exodeoxyribonuclease V alpha subunit
VIWGSREVFANRIVKNFGKELFNLIEAKPRRLSEVEGIWPKRASKITSAKANQKAIC